MGDGVHLGLGRVNIDARLEARHDAVVVLAANSALSGSEGQGHPELSVFGIAKTLGHNADDGVWRFVESNVATDERGVGAKLCGPNRVAQNYYMLMAGLI